MDVSQLFMHNFTCFLQLFGTVCNIVYNIIHSQEVLFDMNSVEKYFSDSQQICVQNLGTRLLQWGIY